MRKPRDFDAELKTLTEKAKQLKARRLDQLGELVIATGADALPIEQLAGALLSAAETKELSTKEGWRKRGAAFFQGTVRAGNRIHGDQRSAQAGDGGTASAQRQDGS